MIIETVALKIVKIKSLDLKTRQTKQKEPMSFTQKDIVHREWRFGMHLGVDINNKDVHLVKEVVTLADGSKHPYMRRIEEYERPVWSTKRHLQTYHDKKEYEHVSKLDMHMVTQSKLRNKVALLTDNAMSSAQLSELLVSPYIFAGDVPSTTILHRQMYQKPNEGKTPTPYKYAAFDTETDVLYGTNQIIIASMTMLPYVHLVIRKDWLDYKGADVESDIIGILKQKIDPLMEEFYRRMDTDDKGKFSSLFPKEDRELKFSFEIVDTEIEIVEKSFAWFHHRMPDWMGIWNIDFDVTKVLNCCKANKLDPAHVLGDPRIPPELRVFKYRRSAQFKVAASGKGKPVSPHDQWNVLTIAASFFAVDASSAYRLLRLGEQEERSYSLDAILHKEFKGAMSKLSHPPADKYVKEKWHQVMQQMHKLVYLAYAAVDTISMCLLDRKTRDLSHRLPAMADITDFSQCNSQPKRLRDAFFVFALEDHQSVIGSVGYEREYKKKEPEPEIDLGDALDYDGDFDEEDEEEEATVLDRRNWVLTLPSHYSSPGLRLIEGSPEITTGIRAFVYDSDAVSSYPSCTQVANVSKITTRKEISSIEGMDERQLRMNNINLIAGPVNAVEYTTNMFGAPTLYELLDIYDTQKAETI